MLMEVKNQIKVMLLSTKYALQREMLNKVTFISNVLFMILNNASFIVQWIILYSLKFFLLVSQGTSNLHE